MAVRQRLPGRRGVRRPGDAERRAACSRQVEAGATLADQQRDRVVADRDDDLAQDGEERSP